ncbi:MAG: prephenate dehydratase [Chthoniobacterales bacterium]|nr:prephenate dehydratase [Chthoniobacterales bacterium]
MNLDDLRAAVDSVDDRILDLLRERAELVGQIGRLKEKSGGPYYAPEREDALLRRLVSANKSPLPETSIRAIYREILSAMRALEQTITVAYLGPRTTFSHQAAARHFGSSVKFQPERTIPEVFEAVERGRAGYGVVPIENSLEGGVNATLDCFMDTAARICAQTFLPVDLNLLGRVPVEKVRRVYSHPQPFGQCRRWLAAHLPSAECVEVSSTARAAELAASEEGAAAIAGDMAAAEFGLPVLARSIQDATGNVTRFFVIGRQDTRPSGHDKTSVMFAVKDQPGALARALEPFEKSGISLTRIESRPSKRRPWEYYFFADFAGHSADPAVAGALAKLEGVCAFTRLLGSYPDVPAA